MKALRGFLMGVGIGAVILFAVHTVGAQTTTTAFDYYVGSTIKINDTLDKPTSAPVKKIQFVVTYDPALVTYSGFSQIGTIGGGLSVVQSAKGELTVSLDTGTDTIMQGQIVQFQFAAIKAGVAKFNSRDAYQFNTAGAQYPVTCNPLQGLLIPIGDTVAVKTLSVVK